MLIVGLIFGTTEYEELSRLPQFTIILSFNGLKRKGDINVQQSSENEEAGNKFKIFSKKK